MRLRTRRSRGAPGHTRHAFPDLSLLSSPRRPLIHPRFRQLPPPLIVIGMHRSGTSPVAAILASLGVYMGPVTDGPPESVQVPAAEQSIVPGYAEAEEFRQLNEILLARAGASWDRIEPFLEVRNQPGFARRSTALLQVATFTRLRTSFLRALPAVVIRPWGWKDPRSSLTLPLWLRLFPDARIIHVHRNQEAVVASLHRRSQDWHASPGPPLPLGQRARFWALHPWTTLRRAGRRFGLLPPAPPDPCLDLDYCRSLCRQYVEECLRYREWGDRYLEVSYEELIEAPTVVVDQLARFAGCSVSPERLIQAAALVRRSPERRRSPAEREPCPSGYAGWSPEPRRE